MIKFIKNHKWIVLAVIVVVLYWQRIAIAEAIYEISSGKISLFGVKGGSV